ncbi:hypothetical protein P7K49_000413 [Saguinus oedipus]|uniref:Uncharacterized protein n=1 Tax=Saguinus oedipus TaxID=9490 RepID=A0ABQ9WBK6_SAGOE|nr:hypothetical protein P7K49_000413 [Saguinus oedipus]
MCAIIGCNDDDDDDDDDDDGIEEFSQTKAVERKFFTRMRSKDEKRDKAKGTEHTMELCL